MKVVGLPTVGTAVTPEANRPEVRPEATSVGGQRPASPGPSPADLELAVQRLNETVALFSTELHFSVHEETNRIIVRVTHSETGEVVREIPPERFLDAVAQVQTALGLLFDERA